MFFKINLFIAENPEYPRCTSFLLLSASCGALLGSTCTVHVQYIVHEYCIPDSRFTVKLPGKTFKFTWKYLENTWKMEIKIQWPPWYIFHNLLEKLEKYYFLAMMSSYIKQYVCQSVWLFVCLFFCLLITLATVFSTVQAYHSLHREIFFSWLFSLTMLNHVEENLGVLLN